MKELKFIHITKNAGSSIEEIGRKHKFLWGMYHHEYGLWHEYFTNKSFDLKTKYDWFMIVRNPYDRILSEFYCNHKGFRVNNMKFSNTKEGFNEYLMYRISNRELRGDHYAEQYKYLDTCTNIVIHILNYENLKNEFDKLMIQYNLPCRLDMKTNVAPNKQLFTIQDFSNELIDLINTVYAKDFESFGYKKIVTLSVKPIVSYTQNCIRPSCNFKRHIDITNNGGTHCCHLCQLEGTHGPRCTKEMYVHEKNDGEFKLKNDGNYTR